jgi:hypothetical protein
MNALNISGERLEHLRHLEAHLCEQIRWQDHVIPRIVAALHRGELGRTSSTRPRGSFLFLGPTGVGKTETTIAFTDYLLGSEKLFRFDMSEYQTQESVAVLIGGRVGEVGLLGLARSNRYRKRDAVTSGVDGLRLIFRVARKETGVHGRTTLANVFEDRIIRCKSPINSTAFGVRSVAELALLFARDIEAMRISAGTFENFISPDCIRGYQSRIRGKLWHLFVRNYPPLDDDFRANALSQLQELNDPKVAASLLHINPAAKAQT